MSEQLALIETGPKLTSRQRFALDAVTRAGEEGLTGDELGAALHEWKHVHHSGDRCRWCGKDGRAVMVALNEKGLVRYRARLKVWQAVELPAVPAAGSRSGPPPDHAGAGPVPFGAFPEGF